MYISGMDLLSFLIIVDSESCRDDLGVHVPQGWQLGRQANSLSKSCMAKETEHRFLYCYPISNNSLRVIMILFHQVGLHVSYLYISSETCLKGDFPLWQFFPQTKLGRTYNCSTYSLPIYVKSRRLVFIHKKKCYKSSPFTVQKLQANHLLDVSLIEQ